MRKPTRVKTAAASIFWLVSAVSAHAVNVTITDNCQRTISGSPSSSTSVAANGDITISGLSGPFVSALGACDSYAVNASPVCTLNASQTMVATGSTISLRAKCSLSPTTYSWRGPIGGPAAPATPTASPAVELTFPSPGAYTYSVAGTSGVTGPFSVPVTILVGDTTSAPNCVATASPPSTQSGGSTRLEVTCNPPASFVTWDSEPGAPTMPNVANSNVVFPNAGVYTYEARGTNTVGQGPITSATVNVSVGGCPATSDPIVPLASGQTIVRDMTTYARVAYSFQLPASGVATIKVGQSAGGGVPTGIQFYVAPCPGDFSATTTVCNKYVTTNPTFNTLAVRSSPLFGSCVIQPNVTYYVNVRYALPQGIPQCGSSCRHAIYRDVP